MDSPTRTHYGEEEVELKCIRVQTVYTMEEEVVEDNSRGRGRGRNVNGEGSPASSRSDEEVFERRVVSEKMV
jgi:hypothetical protein